MPLAVTQTGRFGGRSGHRADTVNQSFLTLSDRMLTEFAATQQPRLKLMFVRGQELSFAAVRIVRQPC